MAYRFNPDDVAFLSSSAGDEALLAAGGLGLLRHVDAGGSHPTAQRSSGPPVPPPARQLPSPRPPGCVDARWSAGAPDSSAGCSPTRPSSRPPRRWWRLIGPPGCPGSGSTTSPVRSAATCRRSPGRPAGPTPPAPCGRRWVPTSIRFGWRWPGTTWRQPGPRLCSRCPTPGRSPRARRSATPTRRAGTPPVGGSLRSARSRPSPNSMPPTRQRHRSCDCLPGSTMTPSPGRAR